MWREASPGAWYLQIPAPGLGSEPGPRPPRAPRFKASVQNLEILGTRPRSGPVRGGGDSKNGQTNKVLRMRFSIVENVRTPSDIIFIISRGLQLPYNEKSKNLKNL